MRQSSALCVAGLVAAGLLFSPPPIVLADQPTQAATTVKQHVKKHQPRLTQHAPADTWAQPKGCTWPYQNQIPPCMSTWPAGDPNYHGSRPGPIPGE